MGVSEKSGAPRAITPVALGCSDRSSGECPLSCARCVCRCVSVLACVLSRS